MTPQGAWLTLRAVGLVAEKPRQSVLLRRLRVGIRAKLILALVLTATPMVGLIGWFGLGSASDLIRQRAVTEMSADAVRHGQLIANAVADGAGDAAYLARSDTVRRFARACVDPNGPPELLTETVRDFSALAQTHGLYAQIRYLDLEGRERARVNYDQGIAAGVPEGELQSKAPRYYVEETLALGPGPVYVSPPDLNREQLRIQRPLRPVIRFAACVADGESVLGIVVLNRDARDFLPSTIYQGGATYLVDSRGYYLSHSDASKAWSGPDNLDTGHTLLEDLGDFAAPVLHPQPGPPLLQVRDSVIARYPIILQGGRSPRFVVLCVESPEASLYAGLQSFTQAFWTVLLLSVIAPIIPGLVLASFFLTPLRSLRKAVHDVAEGDLSSTADVRSGDEFRDLADDFNSMAAKLQEYRKDERTALVGRMARTIIHDVRNPLSSVNAFARVLADRDLPPEERRAAAHRVMEQVDRIQEMLQEILEFSRGEGGHIERDHLSFEELFGGLKAPLEAQCAEGGITLRLSADVDCVLHADKARLQRAVSNITTNACEAMADGGTLAIRSLCADDAVVIEITDTGPGIPREIVDQLMEPLVTHGKSNGTGLGLAIAKAVVEAHGGTLSAANLPEGGARFTINLPVVPPGEAPRADGEYVI